jgi:hypothetical protein
MNDKKSVPPPPICQVFEKDFLRVCRKALERPGITAFDQKTGNAFDAGENRHRDIQKA